MRRQIADERERHLEAREREERAARARLNDALSALCRFSILSAAKTLRREPLTYYDLPHEAVKAVQDAIEKIDTQTANALSDLVFHYQIHNARLMSTDFDEVVPIEYANRLYDSVLLYAVSEHFFDYARRKIDRVENTRISRERMEAAMHITVGYSGHAAAANSLETLEGMIQRWHKDG